MSGGMWDDATVLRVMLTRPRVRGWGIEVEMVCRNRFCPPDYNMSATLEVQDIFDFLNAWSAGCE
jgi:hypothetical protein